MSAPDDRATGDLRVGETLAGRYEVQGLLGVGGMGAVYRVRDRKLEETVALKVLARISAASIERFSREVRLGRKVTHPNIVRTHDLGEHEGIPFLTMELVEGRSLEAIIEERGPLAPDEVVAIGLAIASGLHAAHEAGVVHRDLKPANVLVGADDRVRITDFGIARGSGDDSRTHETGAILGTPHYMAPEQVSGEPVDARTDIYSLGCMFYEMLTGEPPFVGPTPLAVVSQRILHDAPEDIRRRVSVSEPLAALVMSCLRREPAQRPQTAWLVAEALRSGTAPTGRTSRVSLFAPLLTDEPAVAVLPFTYRGAAEHRYLGEGLAEELIDVLSRTRGLKVLALGATRRFAESRDPLRIASELGASVVVDGTVHLGDARVRSSARLVDAEGVQLWSQPFEGHFSDVLDLQESMGRRVAESLRLQLQTARHRGSAPEEAIALYLRGRRGLMADVLHEPERAEAELRRALELAPRMEPAIAALAMASVRAWWGHAPDPDGRRAARAEQNVRRALEDAPMLGESQLAAAMLAVQAGDFREAARATGRALDLVPTLAFAHHYLGALQIEAGREREGRDRLHLALELDPSLRAARFSLARLEALRGRQALFAEHIDALTEAFGGPTMPLCGLQFREALWRGDEGAARRWWRETAALGTAVATRTAELFGLALGEGDPKTVEARVGAMTARLANARFSTLMHQIGTEVSLAAGLGEQALAMLERAAEGALIDIVWLRRCPLLAGLHPEPRFQEALRTVDRRARELWRR